MAIEPVGFANAGKFQHVFHFKYAGAGSGKGPNDALPIALATDVMSIPAGTLIDRVYVIVDTAITGTTNLDVGDDDDADGFVDGSLSITLGTPAIYGHNAKLAGAYLRVETAGGTDAADIDVVPTGKFYAAAGKEIKVVTTTTNTAGAFRVVVEGSYLPIA